MMPLTVTATRSRPAQSHHDYSHSLLQHNQPFYKQMLNGVRVSYRAAPGACGPPRLSCTGT
jgi:hypothetical protein